MSAQLVKELVDAGVHFGHRASRWNPKMSPYIYTKRNLIHIINVKETLRGLLLAKRFLARVVADGQDVLIVGTKRQARRSVEETAERTNMHYVTERWLGGTLTNFREIRRRIGRLEELEKLEADGMLDAYSKKEGASLRRELRKIERNLGGIRNMTRLPGAMVVVDEQREIIAVREANKLNIPVVCLLDTDGDPDLVNIPIPGNDDAMKAVELICKELGDAIAQGVKGREAMVEQAAEGDQQSARRRSRRPTTARAEEAAAEPAGEQPSQEQSSDQEATGQEPAEEAPAEASPQAAPSTETPAEAPTAESTDGESESDQK